MASNQTLRANVAKQRSRYRAIGAQNRVRAWRARAIKNGDAIGLFKHDFTRKLVPDVRAAIDEAVAAERVSKITRGVSGIDYGS
jgi:hypothetical protein